MTDDTDTKRPNQAEDETSKKPSTNLTSGGASNNVETTNKSSSSTSEDHQKVTGKESDKDSRGSEPAAAAVEKAAEQEDASGNLNVSDPVVPTKPPEIVSKVFDALTLDCKVFFQPIPETALMGSDDDASLDGERKPTAWKDGNGSDAGDGSDRWIEAGNGSVSIAPHADGGFWAIVVTRAPEKPTSPDSTSSKKRKKSKKGTKKSKNRETSSSDSKPDDKTEGGSSSEAENLVAAMATKIDDPTTGPGLGRRKSSLAEEAKNNARPQSSSPESEESQIIFDSPIFPQATYSCQNCCIIWNCATLRQSVCLMFSSELGLVATWSMLNYVQGKPFVAPPYDFLSHCENSPEKTKELITYPGLNYIHQHCLMTNFMRCEWHLLTAFDGTPDVPLTFLNWGHTHFLEFLLSIHVSPQPNDEDPSDSEKKTSSDPNGATKSEGKDGKEGKDGSTPSPPGDSTSMHPVSVARLFFSSLGIDDETISSLDTVDTMRFPQSTAQTPVGVKPASGNRVSPNSDSSGDQEVVPLEESCEAGGGVSASTFAHDLEVMAKLLLKIKYVRYELLPALAGTPLRDDLPAVVDQLMGKVTTDLIMICMSCTALLQDRFKTQLPFLASLLAVVTQLSDTELRDQAFHNIFCTNAFLLDALQTFYSSNDAIYRASTEEFATKILDIAANRLNERGMEAQINEWIREHVVAEPTAYTEVLLHLCREDYLRCGYLYHLMGLHDDEGSNGIQRESDYSGVGEVRNKFVAVYLDGFLPALLEEGFNVKEEEVEFHPEGPKCRRGAHLVSLLAAVLNTSATSNRKKVLTQLAQNTAAARKLMSFMSALFRSQVSPSRSGVQIVNSVHFIRAVLLNYHHWTSELGQDFVIPLISGMVDHYAVVKRVRGHSKRWLLHGDAPTCAVLSVIDMLRTVKQLSLIRRYVLLQHRTVLDADIVSAYQSVEMAELLTEMENTLPTVHAGCAQSVESTFNPEPDTHIDDTNSLPDASPSAKSHGADTSAVCDQAMVGERSIGSVSPLCGAAAADSSIESVDLSPLPKVGGPAGQRTDDKVAAHTDMSPKRPVTPPTTQSRSPPPRRVGADDAAVENKSPVRKPSPPPLVPLPANHQPSLTSSGEGSDHSQLQPTPPTSPLTPPMGQKKHRPLVYVAKGDKGEAGGDNAVKVTKKRAPIHPTMPKDAPSTGMRVGDSSKKRASGPYSLRS